MKEISIWRPFDFDGVDFPNGDVLFIRGNIESAEIRDNGPDEEIDIIEYKLSDMQIFVEALCCDEFDGYVEIYEDMGDVVGFVTRVIRDDKGWNKQIEEVIRDEFWGSL